MAGVGDQRLWERASLRVSAQGSPPAEPLRPGPRSGADGKVTVNASANVACGATMTSGAALSLTGVYKSFGAVRALDGVSMELGAGQITSLVGQNGSGKSTLMRVVVGDERADRGEVRVAGRLWQPRSVREATAGGVGIAFQELSVVPDLSVANNLLLGVEPLLGRAMIRQRRLRQQAEAVLAGLDLPVAIDVSAAAGELTLAQQQLIEVARVLSRRPAVAIFDEPTSALSASEVNWLFAQLSALARAGSAVLFISHRLKEVYKISDRIVVLRNGKDVLAGARGAITESALVHAMLGQQLEKLQAAALPEVRNEPLLELQGVRLPRSRRAMDLVVRRGEIVGIGGLQGQGQRELLLGLAGRGGLTGTVSVAGERIRARSPRDAIRHGISLIPEDRRTEGLLLGLSVRENVFVGASRRGEAGLSRAGWLSRHAEAVDTCVMMGRLEVKAKSQEVSVETLSGGNQQKVLIARVLLKHPAVLLLADIARGVDVGAKADIFSLLRELARSGVGILFYSTDATELVGNCHRVAVFHDHTVEAILEGAALTEENIARAAVGMGGHGGSAEASA